MIWKLPGDERVLKILGEDSRKDYARSLLSMAEAQNRRMGVLPFLAFGESNLKQRVGNILKYHRKTLLSVLAALLAVLLVGCSLLANPSVSEDPSDADDGQDAAQSQGQSSQASQPDQPQEPGVAVKDPGKYDAVYFPPAVGTCTGIGQRGFSILFSAAAFGRQPDHSILAAGSRWPGNYTRIFL